MKTGGLKTFTLVMLITGAVDSIRNLPATALFGSSLIFFFVFAAIIFLIPSALISAELTAASPDKGGIYQWVKSAFGEKCGFLAIWIQWISNLVWFPTILSFVAGVITYLIDPELAQNKVYLISIILGTFWLLTILNFRGIELSAKFTSICTVLGLVIPIILIIALAIVWFFSSQPLQIDLSLPKLLPDLKNSNNWISLTAIMTSFVGMELAAVHVKDVENPQKTFPRALYLSVWIILVTMILGSLAIAFVLPAGQISLVNGVLQAFSAFFKAYHIAWIMPIVTMLILIGTLGGIISWVISPAKGLLQAAQSGYLPAFFQKENKYGVATNLLLTQAVIVSVVCLAFLLLPSVSGSYWLLSALSTQLYMIMYILMFAAGLYLRYKYPQHNRPFKIPGGKLGIWIVALLGLSGCLMTIVVGFFPPTSLNVGSVLQYETLFCGGMLVMLLPSLLFYSYKNKNRNYTVALNFD